MSDSTLAVLSAASTLTGSELIYGTQSGADVKITPTQVKTLALGGFGTGVLTFLNTPTSANLASALTDETGSGAAVFATSPSLTTPTIGVATATSVNKVALTAPATSATLTIADGKTLTASNSITIAGTDSTTMTFPSSSANVSALNLASQTLSGGAHVTVFDNGTKSSGTFTVDCGNCPLQKCVNGGAFTLAAPAADGSCMLMVTNNGSAGAITFSGFSVGSNTGDALTTVNTNVFTISIWRINGVSGYRIAAHQ